MKKLQSILVGLQKWWSTLRANQSMIQQLQDEIAERKQAEMALQQVEDIYRRTIDAAGAVPYILKHEANTFTFTFIGEGILSLTGYSASEMTADLWNSLRQAGFPRGRLAHLTFEEADHLTNEDYSLLWECDIRIRTRDGQTRWIADTSVKRIDEKSKDILSIGIYQDITERKLAELSREHAEDLYRRAIMSAGAVPYVLDHATHTVTFMGEGIFAMTGYSASEMLSANVWNAVVQEGFPRGNLAHLSYEEADRLTNMDNSIPWECDFRILTRDGQTRWIADTSVKSFDENSKHVISIGIKQDITERKRIETELRASEERLEILHDIDRALLSARSSEEIASSTLARVRQLIPCLRISVALFDPGSPHAHFFAIDDNWGSLFSDESIMVEEHIVATLKQGVPWKTDDRLSDSQVSNYDERLANEAGIRTWLSLPLLYQGQLIGSLNLGRGLGQPFTQQDAEIAQGIANQLAIAIQQAQLNKELQNQLAERERLIGELGATNAELERFNYTVSHELKSPVVTIKGFLGSITTDLQNGKYERAQKDILRVSSATDKLYDTLSNLLELAKIGYTTNPPEEIDLVQLAHAALETVHNRIQTGNITVHISPDLPTGYGDRILLREVFENLIDNAAKYSGNQPNLVIEVGTRQEKNVPIIFVKDNGMGIDPRYHDRVFHLFEKLNPTSEGTGVGLALVKRIIETHGGSIWVKSDGPGKGSTFCFTIPDRRKTGN